MPISKLSILGYRGFAEEQTLRLAVPVDGTPGSGLTLLVGPNNAGKSTVMESLRYFASHTAPSFSEGRRNKAAGDSVKIRVEEATGDSRVVQTIAGGSESQIVRQPNTGPAFLQIHALPSRRFFSAFFGDHGLMQRDQFGVMLVRSERGREIDQFSARLAKALRSREAFDEVMRRIIDPAPDWTIEKSDQGTWYIKLKIGAAAHNTEGMGEGLVSLLFIVDALYDSQPGNLIAIDEPELSLHPSLLRKLADLLVAYAADRQIICATHSPYFPTAGALEGGATIARAYHDGTTCRIAHLSAESAKNLVRVASDINNPHVFGLDAREVFFLPDRVILVEGQEDVVCYGSVAAQLGKVFKGDFFGWGVGGAEKMGIFASALRDLGYKKVVGILDADKKALAEQLEKDLPNYRFFTIPAADVRTKPERKARPAKTGLLDEKGALRPEYKDDIRALIEQLNGVLT